MSSFNIDAIYGNVGFGSVFITSTMLDFPILIAPEVAHFSIEAYNLGYFEAIYYTSNCGGGR